MNFVNLDKQNVLHCGNCGCSFFTENSINRITADSALKLVSDKKSDDISGGEKICPLDHGPLRPMDESEAIPQDITILQCENCRGVFVYPDDLLAFKKAQAAKVDYYKAWIKPLPALRTVLVISFAALVLGTVVLQSNTFINKFSYQSQASDLITKINFSKSGRYLFVFFKTKSPQKSIIIFTDKTANLTIKKVINTQTSTIHQLTTADVNYYNEIWYQVILVDSKGKEVKTESKKLIISN